MRVGPLLLANLAAVAAMIASGPVRAAETVEPSYGRVDGDMTFVVGAGGSVGSSGVRAAGELRARYLETAGLFGTYEDGAVAGTATDPARVVVVGLELRPLFLYRWLKDQETRRARWDLTVDSIGLELGAAWYENESLGGLVARPGIEAGLGIEVPVMPEATGLWFDLHGGGRWNDRAQGSGSSATRDREAYLVVTLAWHQVAQTHVVDAGDQAPR